MAASHFYLSKPGWQKPAYLAGIVLLHVLFLLFVRQTLQGKSGRQDIFKYLDVSFVATLPKAQPPAPRVTATVMTSQPITQLPQRLHDNKNQSSIVVPAMNNQVLEPDASNRTSSATADASTLDLDGLRKTALADDKKHRRPELGRVPIPATADLKLEEKFGKDVQDAKRKDCLNAYSNGARVGNVTLAGLLVAGVIVADTVTGKGCKW